MTIFPRLRTDKRFQKLIPVYQDVVDVTGEKVDIVVADADTDNSGNDKGKSNILFCGCFERFLLHSITINFKRETLVSIPRLTETSLLSNEGLAIAEDLTRALFYHSFLNGVNLRTAADPPLNQLVYR
jgi:hypothetical protein